MSRPTTPEDRGWRRSRRPSPRRTALLATGAVATASLLCVSATLLWRRARRKEEVKRSDEALAERNERYAG